MQIREQLEQLIDAAVAAACEDGTLTLEQAPEAALERPRDAVSYTHLTRPTKREAGCCKWDSGH